MPADLYLAAIASELMPFFKKPNSIRPWPLADCCFLLAENAHRSPGKNVAVLDDEPGKHNSSNRRGCACRR